MLHWNEFKLNMLIQWLKHFAINVKKKQQKNKFSKICTECLKKQTNKTFFSKICIKLFINAIN